MKLLSLLTVFLGTPDSGDGAVACVAPWLLIPVQFLEWYVALLRNRC
jgi:hypothetical protein